MVEYFWKWLLNQFPLQLLKFLDIQATTECREVFLNVRKWRKKIGKFNVNKNRFRLLKGYICFDNSQERTKLWKTDRFATVGEIWEIFNLDLSIIGISFNWWDIISNETRQLPSASIIPISLIVMVCYWSH